MSHNLDMVL